jgi:hypothetical protein
MLCFHANHAPASPCPVPPKRYSSPSTREGASEINHLHPCTQVHLLSNIAERTKIGEEEEGEGQIPWLWPFTRELLRIQKLPVSSGSVE